MIKSYSRLLILTLGLLLVANGISTGVSLAQEISASLVPAEIMVDPGEEFMVEMLISQPGVPFNGYDALFEYDPAFLTYVALSPNSLQEGALMTGVCGNTFHIFDDQPPDRLSVSHVLLCAGASLTGPGTIYQLRFRANQQVGVTHVRLVDGTQFYNAGSGVGPLVTEDAEITIGNLVDVGELSAQKRLSLSVFPNPTRGSATIRVDGDSDEPIHVRILNVGGRTIRNIPVGKTVSGTSRFQWDGRSDVGDPAPAGLYWVVATRGSETASARFVVLH